MKVRLWNRQALFCLVFLTLQQLINASSNYWLVFLQRNFRIQGELTWGLIGLFCSFLLPYLPAAMAVWMRTRWLQETIWQYIQEFSEKNRFNLALFSDAKAKERNLQILSNEGIKTLEESIQYYNQVATSSLNIICNVLAFGFLIDARFVLAHSLSVFLGFCVVRAQNRYQVDLFKKAQDERIEVGQLLLTSADNVFLGNDYNFRNWRRSLTRRMGKSMLSQQQAVRFRESVAIVASWATYLPCLALAFWIGWKEGYRQEIAGQLIALLPRLAIVLSYTYYMVFLFSQWQSYGTRLAAIGAINEPQLGRTRDLLNARITWENIEWSQKAEKAFTLKSWEEVEYLLQKSAGRITLRGKNGSGKSTLLLLLKMQLAEKSYLLPTQHHLRFRFRAKTRSTGEHFVAQIEEIAHHLPGHIFLLDEWDANLDNYNMNCISERLDQLAQSNLVVEVRHRS